MSTCSRRCSDGETIALDVAAGMLECETTDAGEPLSISTVAHASNRILRSIVTVTVDTTRRRRLFSIRCGRVFSHVTCSHIGEVWGGRSAGLCFHSPTFPSAFPGDGYLFKPFRDISRQCYCRCARGEHRASLPSCDLGAF